MSKWVDEGETNVGDIYFRNQTQNVNLYLGLYLNTDEPAEDDVLADLTEPSGDGYARIILAPAGWTEDPQGTFKQALKIFTAVGGDWGDVYGYFICTVSSGVSGKLIAVEHFSDGPYYAGAGDSVVVETKVAID